MSNATDVEIIAALMEAIVVDEEIPGIKVDAHLDRSFPGRQGEFPFRPSRTLVMRAAEQLGKAKGFRNPKVSIYDRQGVPDLPIGISIHEWAPRVQDDE